MQPNILKQPLNIFRSKTRAWPKSRHI